MYKYEKSDQNILKLYYINFVSSENQTLCINAAEMRLYYSTIETQLTKNVSGTFGFGCMKVWLNLTLLERNAYVRHWSYKCLVEPNVLKTLFKYSDSA